MITIYKYVIKPFQPETEMLAQAEILSVAFQGTELCVWAKVDTCNVMVTRRFRAFGTGHPLPPPTSFDLLFIGTGFMDGGLVFHLFEELPHE